jgi:hypothetical protein
MKLQTIIDALRQHCLGVRNGLPIARLAELIAGEDSATTRRALRAGVQELRMRGVPICAHPNSGYYLAETAEEVTLTIAFLRKRALCTLMQISRLQQALRESNGQIRLPIAEIDLSAEVPSPPSRGGRVIELDQELLQRMEQQVMRRGGTLSGALGAAISAYLGIEN